MSSQASYIQDGQQVLASDLNSFASSAAVTAGAAIASIVGTSDANANDSPLTVVPGSGMTIVVGGDGQKVLVQARLADYIPTQTYAIAAADSSARVDLVAFQYADAIVSTGGTASFLDQQGNLGPQPTSFVYRGIRVTIVKGVPGSGTPAAPAGFDPLATIAIPPGSTTIASSHITLLLGGMNASSVTSASQIIPTTPAQAVFGGNQTFKMAALNIADYFTLDTNGFKSSVQFLNIHGYSPVIGMQFANDYANATIAEFVSVDKLASYITGTGGYVQSSDGTRKTNVVPIAAAMPRIAALTPVNFTWIDGGKHDIGFIAQDVEPIIPEAVSVINGTYNLSFSTLIPLLVRALQEQQTQITSMSADIAHLRSLVPGS